MKKSGEFYRQVFREAIFQSSASEGHSQDQSETLTAKFDLLTSKGKMSAESAANIVLSCYSSNAKEVFENVKTLVENSASASDIALYIQNQLKKAKDYPLPEKDALTRLREIIRRSSKNLDTLSTCTIDGISLTEQELDAAKIKMPEIMKSECHTAKASVQGGKKVQMELEVVGYVIAKFRHLPQYWQRIFSPLNL